MPAKKSATRQAFGGALRLLRRERGYSQERFAAHAGLDRSYYGAIERGEFNVRLSTILTLADGLDVRLSEIFLRAKL